MREYCQVSYFCFPLCKKITFSYWLRIWIKSIFPACRKAHAYWPFFPAWESTQSQLIFARAHEHFNSQARAGQVCHITPGINRFSAVPALIAVTQIAVSWGTYFSTQVIYLLLPRSQHITTTKCIRWHRYPTTTRTNLFFLLSCAVRYSSLICLHFHALIVPITVFCVQSKQLKLLYI